jgi:hypothetical protein
MIASSTSMIIFTETSQVLLRGSRMSIALSTTTPSLEQRDGRDEYSVQASRRLPPELGALPIRGANKTRVVVQASGGRHDQRFH